MVRTPNVFYKVYSQKETAYLYSVPSVYSAILSPKTLIKNIIKAPV